MTYMFEYAIILQEYWFSLKTTQGPKAAVNSFGQPSLSATLMQTVLLTLALLALNQGWILRSMCAAAHMHEGVMPR